MKVEKFKVLLYLKKSGLDKSGKAPIMGRITVNRTMAQFSSKLSCTPGLWNPRESRLNGKSKEAVEINAKIDKLLLAINSAFDSLLECKIDFDATAVKEAFQGSVETQMTLLKRLDIHIDDMQSRIGIDVAKSSMSTYIYTCRYLGEFIKKRFKVEDLAFGQLNEHMAYEFQEYVLKDKGLAVDTPRHYLAILKKICRLAFKEGHAEKRYFVNFKLPKENRKAPRALSREDFEKIRDLEIPASRVTHNIARDLFLFACYTGVPYADAVSITDDNIYTDDNGALWLKYLRKKNEHFGRVKLLPEAIVLIEKYRSNERKELFPMIHHPNLRRHMKGLRDLAGIKTDLVYHMGRHTFGSLITLEAGVPIETISKIKADGTTSIMCRVTIDGKAIVLATGRYCTPNEWNSKKGETKNSRINGMLNDYKNRIDDTYNSLLKTNGVITAELLKNAITSVSDIPKYILQAGEIERGNLKIRSVQIDSTSSYRGSKMYQHYLCEYINSLGKEDMLFTDITEEFGNNFVLYMKMNYSHKPSYRNHCLCWLKRLVYLAVDNGILRFNPIEDVQYEKKPPKKLMYISKSQLQDIMNHPKPGPLQELARRTFIFSYFCGLAYVDVQRLYPHHIGITAEGRKYIRTCRKKTDVEAFIPLHPIAEQILSLYNTTDDSKPIFPLPCRDMIWFEIHELGFAHQFKHNLSYHQSRHTFGTLLVSAGVPMESIAKMMGHTNIRTTQGYAKVTDDKISEDMDRLMENMKK